MSETIKENSKELTEHFFRSEYGKIVSVITRYIGTEHVETAEDIVQETLLKAVNFWHSHGIPENPKAWLYTTAKNLTLNAIKKKKYQTVFQAKTTTTASSIIEIEKILLSEDSISDEQLKMMFVCCHPSISEHSQIALILKILCGFSISEIANAFFSTNETISKRLTRGRQQLRKNKVDFNIPSNINENISIVLKTIYLLFNEGYSPSNKNELVRYDLCLEAIRLIKILVDNKSIEVKADCYALLALMYLNASRFEARINNANAIIEMGKQDRNNWNQELLNRGVHYLNLGSSEDSVSIYLILAAISANHCIAPRFEDTNWKEILSLYDKLLMIEDTPVGRLNRSVAVSKVFGNKKAISELQNLYTKSDIGKHYLFHSTIAEFHILEDELQLANGHLKQAIVLAQNQRDVEFLNKKIDNIVPITKTQLS